MDEVIKIDGDEYEINSLTDQARATLTTIQFVDKKVNELTNMKALLQRAKNSYVDALKKEVLSNKIGLILDDE
jgi:hypothetical protein